jgi:hypothetical protein
MDTCNVLHASGFHFVPMYESAQTPPSLQVTFELRDLERTTSGPPGTNPKSKILEKKDPPALKEAAAKTETANSPSDTSEKKKPASTGVSKD